MFRFTLPLAAALMLAAAALPAAAHDVKVGDLSIIHPVMRAPAEGAKASGGYMVISNDGATADHLVGAAADIGMTQVHKTEVGADGVATMTEQKSVEIPAGGSVEFAPGGLHVMFMDLSATPKPGDTVPVTLTFEKAGAVKVEFMVEDMKDSMDMDHSGHSTGGSD